MQSAYRTIDIVRATAALTVAWSHLWAILAESTEKGAGPIWRLVHATSSLGHDAVMIFFVVSGYWIAHSITGRLDRGLWSWPDYLSDRVVRLWTVLLPALVLGGSLDLVGRYLFQFPIYLVGLDTDKSLVDIGDGLRATNWFVSAFFLIDVYGKALGTNGPLWSLTCEFWYYIWFPLLYIPFVKRTNLLMPFVIFTITAYIIAGPFSLFSCWLVGVFVFLIIKKLNASRASKRRRVFEIVISSALFLLGLCISHSYVFGYMASSLAVALGFGILLTVIIRHDLGPGEWARPIADFGANSSFSLYAIHMPMIFLVKALIDPQNTMRASAMTLALAVAILVGLSVAGYRFSLLTERRTKQIRIALGRALDNMLNKPSSQ